ncbi:MAG: outer membrane protein transport protein [Verrucomicrobiota bacterium]
MKKTTTTKTNKPTLISNLALLATLATCSVQATDGYFSHGYGIKAKGRAGVALTETDDAFGGANNPAALTWADNQLNLGIDWFRPDRSAERTGPAKPFNARVVSDSRDFFIPEIAYKRAFGKEFSLGISIYGNGGMNTDYSGGQLNLGPGATSQNLLAGSGHLGVNLSQLLIAPTVAWKFAENHSIGLAPILAYQTFKAYGLQAFSPLSQDATALSNVGNDYSFGGGARLGYLWKVTPDVSLGAAYSSRVYTSRFDKYRGLFAGNGSFDIPQSVGVGIGWQALPALRLGVDYKWIDYASIAAVGNPSSNAGQLGQEHGPGFGWRSISTVKVGADWQVTKALTFRAGYGFSENPVQARDVTFNILAPAVVQHHLTFGATYDFGRHDISVFYLHAFENSVTGESKFVALGKAPAGTRETIAMSQDSIGIAYSYKF